jgi:hypothetical protein
MYDIQYYVQAPWMPPSDDQDGDAEVGQLLSSEDSERFKKAPDRHSFLTKLIALAVAFAYIPAYVGL